MRELRRGILIVCICATLPGPTFGQEPARLQQPPASSPDDVPALSPLLLDQKGQPLDTPRKWRRHRTRLREQWLEFMGEFPGSKAPLKTTIIETEKLPGFTRQYVRYQVEGGVFTDGYLLVPDHSAGKKLPAVVVFHSTVKAQARIVAGVDISAPEKSQGLHLVERGCVVWCPRNFIFDEGADYAGNVKRMRERHPDWTGMARMTRDAVRAADFLESLPYVDRKRIGAIGHSLGAKVALYAAAFDERYRATVSSEGGIGLKFSNWDAVWYLGPAIREPDFPLENHQVLALVAPRPFLLLAGESADNDRSWAFIEAVQPVYALLGAPENIGWFNHRQGHRYSPEARAVAEAFLERHLKNDTTADKK